MPVPDVLFEQFERTFYRTDVVGLGRSKNQDITLAMLNIGPIKRGSSDHTHDAGRNFAKEKGKAKAKKVREFARGSDIAILVAVCTRGSHRGELLHAVEGLIHNEDAEIRGLVDRHVPRREGMALENPTALHRPTWCFPLDRAHQGSHARGALLV